ncbi:MAG TPA: class I SAM-dependent methyltransferase [Draconibacterium sp.]|nr:class I SAM-dependent methyltransferase [Draconibacterium sp.]
MNDPFGAAIYDYLKNGKAPDIRVDSNYTEDESIPVAWFFRTFEEMPAIEKKALELCRGTVLDVGAAAGCHSLFLQQNDVDVTALEKSELATKVLRERGVKSVIQSDIYEFRNQSYDTILLLMNGTGIGGTLAGLKMLFFHLKKLLNPGGQILIDSSDIKYLFEEEDGSMWIDLGSLQYYGEMEYEVKYKHHKSNFDWLFVDFDTLKKTALEAGLNCKMILRGEHFDYLAALSF